MSLSFGRSIMIGAVKNMKSDNIEQNCGFRSHYITEWALITDKTGVESKYLLILKNGYPLQIVNKRMMSLQKGQIRPRTTQVYNFCKFLNYLSDIDKEIETATMTEIYTFLSELYIEENMKCGNIKTYCNAIAMVYELYAILGIPLDDSIYREDTKMILTGKMKGKTKKTKEYITKVNKLIYFFSPTKRDYSMPLYLKWYQDFEIEGIANELQLAYRCIFFITIYTGFRIDSVLSINMDTFSLKNCFVKPTRTKTGLMHAAYLPISVINILDSYISEIRTPIALQTGFLCKYLFLTQNGKNKGQAISYEAYRNALIIAAKKAKEKNSLISTNIVHTHAGRSTFLSRIRSYQLEEKRLGNKALSDEDLCLLMDWKSLQCIENYDLMTRIQELSPFVGELMDSIYDVSKMDILTNKEKQND